MWRACLAVERVSKEQLKKPARDEAGSMKVWERDRTNHIRNYRRLLKELFGDYAEREGRPSWGKVEGSLN